MATLNDMYTVPMVFFFQELVLTKGGVTQLVYSLLLYSSIAAGNKFKLLAAKIGS